MAGNRGDLTGLRDFEPIISAMAQWLRLCRSALGARGACEVRAADAVATPLHGLDQAVVALPNSAALLRKMMIALGVEPDAPALPDHAAMDELRRLCVSCENKAECAHDLAEGTATDNFYAYCPNARALDSIYVEMTFNRL